VTGLFVGVILASVTYFVLIALAVAWSRQAAFQYYRLHPEKREYFSGAGPLPRHFWQFMWTSPPRGAFATSENIWSTRHADPELERARARFLFRQRVVAAVALLGWTVVLPVLNFRP
jgi:hypothetical protein